MASSASIPLMRALTGFLGLTMLAVAQHPTDKPTFRAESRMVIVDVVVAVRRGAAVSLSKQDFDIFEDGKKEEIRSFSQVKRSREATVSTDSSEVPEDAFSNQRMAKRPLLPPLIILLDILNTPSADRERARSATFNYLKAKMSPNQQVAILGLGHRLFLLQDFTTDSGRLMTASRKPFGNAAEPNQRYRDSDRLAQTASLAGGIPAQMIEAMKTIEDAEDTSRTSHRVEITLNAMKSIARMSDGFPGRKSLIWISGAFPFFLDNRSGITNYEQQVDDAARALNSAQVAVYPIDVRGLIASEFVPQDIPISVQFTGDSRLFNDKFSRESRDILDPQESMRDIAGQTGGKAYYNRNDIDQALAEAVDDSAEYYTLAYYPSNKQPDGKFRKIEVRVKRPGVELRYRRGYFASDLSVRHLTNSVGVAEKDLRFALEDDPVTSTQVLFLAHLDPASPQAAKPFRAEFFVKGNSLAFLESGGRFSSSLTFGFAVRKEDGKVVSRWAETRRTELSAEQRERAARSGFLFSVPVTAANGAYTLRLGVRDNVTGRIGTLDVPLTLP
jgi:VWFA-related protein